MPKSILSQLSSANLFSFFDNEVRGNSDSLALEVITTAPIKKESLTKFSNEDHVKNDELKVKIRSLSERLSSSIESNCRKMQDYQKKLENNSTQKYLELRLKEKETEKQSEIEKQKETEKQNEIEKQKETKPTLSTLESLKSLESLESSIKEMEKDITDKNSFISSAKAQIDKNKKKISVIETEIQKLITQNYKLKLEMTKQDEKNLATAAKFVSQNSQNNQLQEVYHELAVCDSNESNIDRTKQEIPIFYDKLRESNIEIINAKTRELAAPKAENEKLENQISENNALIIEINEFIKEQSKNKKPLITIKKQFESEIKKEKSKIQDEIQILKTNGTEEFLQYILDLSNVLQEINQIFNEFDDIKKMSGAIFDNFNLLKRRLDCDLESDFRNADDKNYYPFYFEAIKQYTNNVNTIIVNNNLHENKNNDFICWLNSDIDNKVMLAFKTFLAAEADFEPNQQLSYDNNNDNYDNTLSVENFKVKPGAIINITFRHKHFLKKFRSAFSHLLYIGNLEENKKMNLFLEMFLHRECNDQEKEIFNKLSAKKQKNNKFLIIDEESSYCLLMIAISDEINIDFLINLVKIVKIPEHLISLINRFEKTQFNLTGSAEFGKIWDEIKKVKINFYNVNNKYNDSLKNNFFENLESLYKKIDHAQIVLKVWEDEILALKETVISKTAVILAECLKLSGEIDDESFKKNHFEYLTLQETWVLLSSKKWLWNSSLETEHKKTVVDFSAVNDLELPSTSGYQRNSIVSHVS